VALWGSRHSSGPIPPQLCGLGHISRLLCPDCSPTCLARALGYRSTLLSAGTTCAVFDNEAALRSSWLTPASHCPPPGCAPTTRQSGPPNATSPTILGCMPIPAAHSGPAYHPPLHAEGQGTGFIGPQSSLLWLALCSSTRWGLTLSWIHMVPC
jgi:hypothetical protein